MKSASEIATQCVQEELYARIVFAKLIAKPAVDFRLAVETDARSQTEFMARHILDYFDAHHRSLPVEHALELIKAAQVAGRDAEAHVRCRVEKELANVFRYVGEFACAEAALRRAADAARRCASDVHQASIHFALAALNDDRGFFKQADEHADAAIRGFEESGASDRTHCVRLYEAFMRTRRGEHLAALGIYQDAAHLAQVAGADEELAVLYYNIGQCYRSLADFVAAKAYFAKSARTYHRAGVRVLEAQALRCVARMSIRVHGEAGSSDMEVAKQLFLALDSAGEVCRSTIAVMEELLAAVPEIDLGPYERQITEEAGALGVFATARGALARLHAAIRDDRVTSETLHDLWSVFGPQVTHTPISGMATIQN